MKLLPISFPFVEKLFLTCLCIESGCPATLGNGELRRNQQWQSPYFSFSIVFCQILGNAYQTAANV